MSRRVYWFSGLCCLAFLACTFPIWAQPTMTGREFVANMSFEDCVARTDMALAKDGWGNFRRSVSKIGSAFVSASKGDKSALITCMVGPNRNSWVTIIAAGPDSGGATAARIKLRHEMGLGQVRVTVNTWNTRDWGVITIEEELGQVVGRYTGPGGSLWGDANKNQILLSWKNDTGGGEGEAIFIVKTDGNLEGTWCMGRGCNPVGARGRFTGTKQ